MGRGALVGAWAAGEALYVWRVVHKYHRPPVPGDLLGITALFAVLGLASEYAPAAGLAAAVGWGLDIAAFLRLFPDGLGEQISKTTQTAEQLGGGSGSKATDPGSTLAGQH